MTGAALAWALAERLAAVLPSGFTVRSEGADFSVDAPDGMGSTTSLAHLDVEEVEAQDYADAAWAVLSMAQDVVSETTTEPWPAALGPGLDLAEPGTAVNGTEILLFFGTEDQPVLTLPPIPIS